MAKYQSKLIDRREIAENTMAFRFEKPEGFVFTPGQHVDIVLQNPPTTDEKGNGRDLSIASATYEPYIEIATRMTPSAFKNTLKEIPIGSEVMLKGPGGDFMVHKEVEKPAVFLIGGIGITPIRSIVLSAAREKWPHKLTLFYSNHTPETTPYFDDLVQATIDNPHFRLVAVMSDMERSKEKWEGERGYITVDLLQKQVPNFRDAIYYLSGPEQMVTAMKMLLETVSISDLQIRTEEFSGY